MYKIYLLKNNIVVSLIKFKNTKLTNIDELLLKENMIKIIESDHSVYSDTEIETLKKIIISCMNKKISYEEIYLFAKKYQEVITIDVYKYLTNNGRIELTREILLSYLNNISSNKILLEEKDIYDYNDLLTLKLDGNQLIEFSIGQELIKKKIRFNYTINPYNLDKETIIPDDVQVVTKNKELLLNQGKIDNNAIFLVLAEDCLNSESNLITKIYFPYLFNLNCITSEDLIKEQPTLLSKNKELLDKNFQTYLVTIDLFYDIWEKNNKLINEVSKGINNFSANYYSKSKFIIPLELIFKQFTSSKTIPLIKYNPGLRRDKIYRLFSDGLSDDGRKVPYLSKSQIIKLAKDIGTRPGLSFYYTYTNDISLVIEINKTGSFYIEINKSPSIQINKLDEIINVALNKIISKINNLLQEGGYNLPKYKDINQLVINDLVYSKKIAIVKKLNIRKYIGCLSKLFNVIESELLFVKCIFALYPCNCKFDKDGLEPVPGFPLL